ncbi:hypothetical protein [Allorhizocola rhizosphaerae]|uniref:hypothetical protein n=1 Tax=Allorhizocola rhizosphaerae TaxID=1872709 RepID=UPI000E3B929E|nr:hypothetical protein [Allorhizocola rhizosphaerae]
MTEESRPIRWRLGSIASTGDEACFAAVVSAPEGQCREYLFRRDATTIGGRPAFGWDATDWDEHTLYDRGSFKAVMDAVKAFYKACQHKIALGDSDNRQPQPGSVWRLIEVRATDDDSCCVAVVSHPDGQTREYPFVQQPITVGGEPGFMWDTNEWDRDTLFDRASYKAVLDAVHAFYEARQREMALGDDKERKPPGL